MKKIISKTYIISLVLFFLLVSPVVALSMETNTFDYAVKSGDSIWKICLKYQVGVSELLSVNPQVSNPDLIYPGQILRVPNLDDIKNLENEVARLVNVERNKQGLSSLKINWQLSRIARYKSQDMIDKNYFSHTSPTYGSPFQMIKDFGMQYTAAGENIAYGQNSASSVMTSWMNSPGHRSNILSTSYAEIGVGVAKDSAGRLYWTQMFIKR